MTAKRKSKFGFGFLLGALGGGLAALFMNPDTGAKNRKKAAQTVKKIKTAVKGKSPEQVARMAKRELKKGVKKAARKIAREVK